MLEITIVVVCYNAIEYITTCVDSLVNQNYEKDLYEILFVDNESTDGTLDKLLQYEKMNSNSNMRVITNPHRNIAKSRNMGLEYAQHPFVAFVDSDCKAPPDWLQHLAAGYTRYSRQNVSLVGVGGSNVPPTNGMFYSTLHVFLNTFLGNHGSVQGKRIDKDCYVPHLPTVNVMYHKQTILDLGGFDEQLGNIGEDQDLSFRIKRAGYYLLYLKNTAVTHYMRDTYQKWMKNMFVYGKGRARLMLRYPDFVEYVLFFPLLLVLALFLSVFSPLKVWIGVPFFFYLAFMFVYSIIESIKAGKPFYFANLFLIYLITHLSYGIGQGYGLLKYRGGKHLK